MFCTFNLTAALAALGAAEDNVEAFLKAWGAKQTPVDAEPTSAKVYAAVEAKEVALVTKLTAEEGKLANTLGITAAEDLNVAEGEDFSDYNEADAQEALALSIAQSQIATKKIELDGKIALAVTALEAVKTDDVVGSIKALIDGYLVKVEAAKTAVKTADAALVTLQAAGASADVTLDAAFDVSGGVNYTFVVTTLEKGEEGFGNAEVVFDSSVIGGAEFGDFKAVYDPTTKKFSYYVGTTAEGTLTFGEEPLSATAAAANANLQKLLANASAKAVLDATAAYGDALAAITKADAAVAADLVKINAAGVEGGGAKDLVVDDVLANAAKEYAEAVDALSAFNKAKAEFDKLVADIQPVRATAAELAALEKTVADAKEVIADADFRVVDIAGGPLDADVLVDGVDIANDVFLFAGKDSNNVTINNFAETGTDLIYFGDKTYTLVKLADDFTGFENKSIGNVGVLEIFWKETGGDLDLYVELESFAGNASGEGDIVKITLTGFTAAEITNFTGNMLVG